MIEIEVSEPDSLRPQVEAFYEGDPIGGVDLEMLDTAPAVCMTEWSELVEVLQNQGALAVWTYGVKETYLDEDWRGRGIGKAMYRAALSISDVDSEPVVLVPSWCLGGTTSKAARRVWASLARDYVLCVSWIGSFFRASRRTGSQPQANPQAQGEVIDVREFNLKTPVAKMLGHRKGAQA